MYHKAAAVQLPMDGSMVDFMRSYTGPSDREFEEQPISKPEVMDIEAPIVPISELGTTVVDSGQGNILQNVESMIRLGTKKIQFVISGGQVSALTSSYGKDLRRELKERAKAAGVQITGVELSPQRIQGMTGWNPQQGSINEQQRIQNIEEVKNAIVFTADIAGGGGVDIYSNEFQRDILDAKWNKDDKGKKMFYDYKQDELKGPEGVKDAQLVKFLIDKRTGQLLRDSVIRTSDKFYRVEFTTAQDRGLTGTTDASGRVLQPGDYVDLYGNHVDQNSKDSVSKLIPRLDPKTKEFQIKQIDWTDIVAETDAFNKGKSEKDQIRPEEFAYRQRLQTQLALTRGQQHYYNQDLDIVQERLSELAKLKQFAADTEKKMTKEEQRRWVEESFMQYLEGRRGELPERMRNELLNKAPSEVVAEVIRRQQNTLLGHQQQSQAAAQNVRELEEVWNSVETPQKYAQEKTWQSYAEAGMHAFHVTKERKLDKPVYIGPEIGMAGQSYGSHPEEFREIIKKSREEMAKRLVTEKNLTEDAAKDAAKNHIKGMMDTTHLAMWFKHFARKQGDSDQDHIKKFNKWMKDEVVEMTKQGVLGGIQVVDTMTGEHAHLPVGQSDFDMVGIVKAAKEAGFKGDILSEGHEEEVYNKGRILTETWRAFGSPIGSYMRGAPAQTWGGVQSAYFGHTMPTNYVVGGYAPSNDWTLWSETPFE